MAQFTKVNGDFQPVINYDSPAYTNNGLNAVVSGATVQPQGPKLEFFTLTKDTGAFSTANVATIVQTVQQLATIYIYEYTDASDDTFAMAVYPVGAWTAATLDTAVTAAGIAVTVAASATFTN
jgi:hypothetical protein